MTFGLFGLANFMTYKLLQYKQCQQPLLKSPKIQVEYGSYLTKLDNLTERVKKDHHYLKQNIDIETRSKGLIIIEAYYGLDEHIYQIDAGLLEVKIPESIKEYYEA